MPAGLAVARLLRQGTWYILQVRRPYMILEQIHVRHGRSALTLPGRSTPEAALSSEELRALYLRRASPDVARLVREIYRLQSLAR